MKRKRPKIIVHRAKKLGRILKSILTSILSEGTYHYEPDDGKMYSQSLDILLSYGIIRFVRKKKYPHGWRGRGLWWDSPQVFKLGDY